MESRSRSSKITRPDEVVERGLVEAHDRRARDALAAPRLADDPDGLPGFDREVDAVDRLDDPVVGSEVRPEVGDLEQRGHGHVLIVIFRR